MVLSQIRYFNVVAHHGSFSAAAKALGITQPGLTKAIRRLEFSLDCNLFVRMSRGVALTDEGQLFLRHARQLDVQMQDARDEIRAARHGAVGAVRIGAGPSWLSRALPGVVSDMAARYPRLTFRVIGGFNATLMEALRIGDLDLVVSALPDRAPAGLRAIPLTTDTISVVARRDHPLRMKRLLRPDSTLAYAWALPGRDVLLRQRLEALFRVAGLEPPAATIESDSISFIASVLRGSDMISFATSQILHREMYDIEPLQIPRLSMTRSAGVLLRSSAGVSAITQALIDATKRISLDIGAN